MKKEIILLLAAMFCIPVISKDKCSDSDSLVKDGMSKLSSYTFLKEEKVYITKKSKDNGHLYIPMTFNRGVKYKFYLMDSENFSGELIVDVYNNMQRQVLFASNYMGAVKKRYGSLEFTCKSTINGCLDLYFQNGSEGCSAMVVGFKNV